LGAAELIISGGKRVSTPFIIPEMDNLIGKCPPFSFCVPVAAGIVSVFMGNPVYFPVIRFFLSTV
jgi:hypothetical protein